MKKLNISIFKAMFNKLNSKTKWFIALYLGAIVMYVGVEMVLHLILKFLINK